MKKILFPLVALIVTSAMAQTQMHINMKDGSTIHYSVSQIENITWTSSDNDDPGENDPVDNDSIENNPVEPAEAVDLGLPSGLKWASRNVGATAPEDYGYYFAWGETEPKTTYTWDNYKWCKGSYNSLTKYCTTPVYGTVDDKTVLDPEDDAAHVNCGGAWRMPTRAEQKELLDMCSWTWITQKGVKGYEVKGSNGNTIFLPAAGIHWNGQPIFADTEGHYWSSSLHMSITTSAYALNFRWGYCGGPNVDRCDGRTIRPVCQ